MPIIAYNAVADQLKQSSAEEWPAVTLIHGDESLCKKAFDAVMGKLMPDAAQAVGVEAFDGVDASKITTLKETGTNQQIANDLRQQLADGTPGMQIRVRAADGPATGDLVEAAIDDVLITGWVNCTTAVPPAPIFTDGFESGDSSAWSAKVP